MRAACPAWSEDGCWRSSLLLLLVLSVLVRVAAGGQTHFVYWNRTNPAFTEVDAGKSWELDVRLGDEVVVVCPVASSLLPHDLLFDADSAFYLQINSVEELSFLGCLLEMSSKPIINCSDPLTPHSVRIPITQTPPDSLPLAFIPGSSYHWISTSDGSPRGVAMQQYGLCRDENMRLKINVDEALPAPENKEHLFVGGSRAVRVNGKMKQKMDEHGWVDRSFRGTLTYRDDVGDENVVRMMPRVAGGRSQTAWDGVPLDGEEVLAHSRDSYDASADYIISEAAGSRATEQLSFLFLSLPLIIPFLL